jgi:hypothetical protein
MGYQLIETIEVGSGGAASIEFTGIPQDGVDLVLAFSIRNSSTATNIGMSVNGSTSSFTGRRLEGSGSATFSGTSTDNYVLINGMTPSGYTANTFSSGQILFSNYQSATGKSFSVDSVQENNATLSYQTIIAGLWNNTAAITSVGLIGTFAQYSTASLYKITAD